MELINKEVYFDKYCPNCVHEELEEEKDPCNECLQHPKNDYSHKPVKFKEKVTNGKG